MNINGKLKEFFKRKKISNLAISQEYGASAQYIGQILLGKGNIPLDFITWAATKYPDLDLDFLFRDEASLNIVSENENRMQKTISKEKILEDFSKLLDKYVE